jgi:hypothetical protein
VLAPLLPSLSVLHTEATINREQTNLLIQAVSVTLGYAGDGARWIADLEKIAASSLVGHPPDFLQKHAEPPGDILPLVLGSSRLSLGTEGSVVITELLLPAGHSR